MGLIWATLYAYFASGTPLLAAGMYATVIAFGLHAAAQILQGEKLQLLASNAELQKELERVKRQAERDQLTNSWSRRSILDMLGREKARAERTSESLCVCLLDIDHFKDMNDRFGHVTGDRILAAFARRVRGALRTMDSVNSNGLKSAMGRVGGEEFIIVLPLTSLRGALRSAERIRKAVVRRPFEGLHQVTVSIGIAELRPGETVSSLIERADQALYGAKSAGRNRVHCATLDGGPNAIVMPDMSAAG
jgi:diguanylate cyclase (GGDEF)-like protein